MIQIPDNFPSYTAYNAKQLLQQVDTLKAAIKELQDHVAKLEAATAPAQAAKPAKKAD